MDSKIKVDHSNVEKCFFVDLLKKDMEHLTIVMEKLESSIDRFTNINDRLSEKLDLEIQNRKSDAKVDHEKIYSKLDFVENKFDAKFDKLESKIKEDLKDLETQLKSEVTVMEKLKEYLWMGLGIVGFVTWAISTNFISLFKK